MDSPDHPAPRDRAIGLGDLQPVAKRGAELLPAEGLEEYASVVVVQLRGEGPGAVNAERIHEGITSSAGEVPAVVTVRWRGGPRTGRHGGGRPVSIMRSRMNT